MIPKIKLENLEISKTVIGTNSINAILHRNNPWKTWKVSKYFKEIQTAADCFIHLMQEHGMNATVSSPRMKIYEAIQIAQKETGEKLHWLCTPSMRNTLPDCEPELIAQLQWCADHEVSVCMPHRVYTDYAMDFDNQVIGGIKFDGSTPVRFKGRFLPIKGIKEMCQIPYPDISAKIRDLGMIPGLSTHYRESIEISEYRDYDTGLIIQSLNKKGYMSNTTPDQLIKFIQATKRQILNIKPSAAGRLPTKESFKFCLDNIKSNDFLAFGFNTMEQCVEDGKILGELLS